ALGAALPAFRARQIYDAVYRQRAAHIDAISTLPKPLRAGLAGEFSVGLPEVERRYDSTDGTVRYLLKLADGKTVETVWMPESKTRESERHPAGDSGEEEHDWDRATICISSQVGCAVDCQFCMTAKLGLERNL